ncbi:MAG: FtsQ-type POTRA domain-containing protein [Clostridiales bacterium]|jgi:cell division protein FtsQ|nr:FtsQ-type POTRA domain-containing protein [Clostridiales bacterium]
MTGQGGKKGGTGPRDERVYAPTHRAATSAYGADRPARAAAAQGAAGIKKKRTQSSAQAHAPVPSRETPAQTRRAAAKAAGGSTRIAAGEARQPSARQPQTQPSPARGSNDISREAYLLEQYRVERRAKAKKSGSRPPQGYDTIHRLEPLEKPKEKRKKAGKKKEPMPRKRLLSILITVVALSGALAAFYFVFLLEDIVVDGNNQYSDESVASLSGLVTGRHLYLLDLKKCREQIESEPYIDVLEVWRELPRTVHITMREREEAAAIKVSGRDVVIDIDGHVLAITDGADKADLLQVYGISRLGFQVNQNLFANSDLQVQSLLLILEQLRQNDMLRDVQSVDLANPLRITMLTAEGLAVVLGESGNMQEKMRLFKETLPSLRAGGNSSGTLNVNVKGGPVYTPPGVTPVEKPDDAENPSGTSVPPATPTQATPTAYR